jgi:short-subunit dehydrogenase
MDDWALITGASTGIGRELATVFAANHFKVAMVARDGQRLTEVAAELRSKFGIETKVVPCDLSQAGAVAEIFSTLRETPIYALVNNAGFGSYGSFTNTALDLQSDMMQVNMVALVQLTHLFSQPMLARRRGRILNVASTAAFQPGPMVNVYYATKAFVYSFSYALADELKETGVTVTALCPGLTRTAFQHRARMRQSRRWPMMSAREVAEAGYRGLMRGKRVVVPGAMNRIASFFAKRLPPRVTAAIVRKIHQPQPPTEQA